MIASVMELPKSVSDYIDTEGGKVLLSWKWKEHLSQTERLRLIKRFLNDFVFPKIEQEIKKRKEDK